MTAFPAILLFRTQGSIKPSKTGVMTVELSPDYNVTPVVLPVANKQIFPRSHIYNPPTPKVSNIISANFSFTLRF